MALTKLHGHMALVAVVVALVVVAVYHKGMNK
jgi:hypothetical protein